MSNEEVKTFTAISDPFRLIVENHLILNIPHYQRGYAWAETQVNELLNDIQEAINNAENSQYFIGPITLLVKDKGKKEFDVIDGQQRLTTLLLITYYIYKKLKNSHNEDIKEEVITFHQLIHPRKDNKRKPVIRHKRPIERDSLSYILSDYTEPKTDSHILKIYDKTLPNFFGGYDDDKLFEFFKFLIDDTIFIVAECTDDTIAYQVFETLNNRGASLSEIDLIRNRLFSNVSESIDEYWDKWDNLYANFKGALNGMSLDKHVQSLFSFYLICHFGEWIEPKELFVRLKSYLKNRNNNIESNPSEYLLNIITNEQASQAYIKLHKPSDARNSSISGLKEALEDYPYVIIKPLIFILMHKNYSGEVIKQTVQLIGNLIKRTQALGNIPTKKYGTAFSKIAQKVYNGEVEEENFIRALFEKLQEADKNHKNIISDENFINGLCASASIKEDVAKNIFISIYKHERQTTGQGLEKTPDLHIEHILPQTYHEENWGDMFTEDEHSTYYPRLGNLMLLSGSANKQNAQKRFTDKQIEYKKSHFQHIDFLDDYNEWNTETIKTRQKQIAEKITEVWKVEL